MGKVTIHDLSESIAKKHRLSQKDVERFIGNMFDVVNEGIAADCLAKVKGLGSFKVTTVKQRESINVRTGERVVIEGHGKLTFTADTTMRERINKPFAHFETVPVSDGVSFSDVPEEKAVEDVEVETAKEADLLAASSLEDTVAKAPEAPVAPMSASVVSEQKTPEETTETGQPVQSAAEDLPESVDRVAAEPEKDEQEEMAEKSMEASRGATMSAMAASVPPTSSGETVSEELAEEPKKHRWLPVLAALLLILAGLGLGYLLGRQQGSASSGGDQPHVAVSDTVKQDTVALASKAEERPGDTFNKEQVNADVRLKYGAYEIVGIDTVITLREGQTMESYCRATLGSGMLVYFQVLNGVDEMEGGAQLKVPKVKVKKRK